ncbi:hypothetical protein EWI61_06590 [Methylolobus aquaticus]|nr:hypothetical protein EWI61_06590 [Methylolobus aquaticus]
MSPSIVARRGEKVVTATDERPIEGLELRRLLSVFRRAALFLLFLAFAGGLSAWSLANVFSPVFRSTATLLLESALPNIVSIEDIYGIETGVSEFVLTQFEILKSRDLARRVISELHLENSPELNSDRTNIRPSVAQHLPAFLLGPEVSERSPEQEMEVKISRFLKRLSITSVKNTRLATISFESHDPSLAKEVVNAIGQAYIRMDLEARSRVTQGAGSWLNERVDALHDRLVESERRLQGYLEKEHLVDIKGVLTVSTLEIENTSAQLSSARRVRAEAESLHRKVVALGERILQNLEAIPEIMADPGVQDLKQQMDGSERSLAELGRRYGPENPKLIAARVQLDSVKTLLRQQISTVVNGIKNRYEVAKANEEAQRDALTSTKQDVLNIGKKQARLTELQREVDSNRNLYEMFLKRSKEATEAGQLSAPIARFVDFASTPVSPVFPKRSLVGLGAAAIAIFLGGILTLIRELLRSDVRSSSDVFAYTGLQPIALAPFYKAGPDSSVGAVCNSWLEKSDCKEAVRQVVAEISVRCEGKTCPVIVVTSGVGGEGKTLMAMLLSRVMGQTKSVILVEANFRSPVLSDACGAANVPGLVDILEGTSSPQDCIQYVAVGGHGLIVAGVSQPQSVDLFGKSWRLSYLISELQKTYGAVVVDCPAAGEFAEVRYLYQFADYRLYVTAEGGDNSRSLGPLMRSIQTDLKTPVSGILLNKVTKRARA